MPFWTVKLFTLFDENDFHSLYEKSSTELNKSGQGFSQGQQWSLGVDNVHGCRLRA